MNMIDSARKDFDNAIRLEPKSAGLYKLRGIFFRDQKNDPMALADFNKALEINPKNDLVYNNRAQIKDDNKDAKGAMEDYNKAILLNPKEAEYYNIHRPSTIQSNFRTNKHRRTKFLDTNSNKHASKTQDECKINAERIN